MGAQWGKQIQQETHSSRSRGDGENGNWIDQGGKWDGEEAYLFVGSFAESEGLSTVVGSSSSS